VGRWETGVSGVPLLRGAAARFECDIVKRIEAGSHTLVLGSVVATDRSDSPPLGYTGRRYAEARALG
jgi:flavin reductase (DIM6/NTAB) family NADH-FMN oxidoreductase RutF